MEHILSYMHQDKLQNLLNSKRHLPPGTLLPILPDSTERLILDKLIEIDDNISPLSYIEAHYGELAARVLLWTALDEVRIYIDSIYNIRRQGRGIPGWLQAWFAQFQGLTDLELNTLFDPIRNTYPTKTTDAELQTVLSNLRTVAISRKQLFNPTLWVKGNYFYLLNNLIQLSSNVNPFDYIKTNYGSEAANEIAHRLINQLGIPELLTNSTWQWYTLNTRATLSNLEAKNSLVILKQIGFLNNGFTITFSVQIPRRQILALQGFMFLEWQGVESVLDDLGYSYATVYRLPQDKGLSWRFVYGLQVICSPGLSNDAKELFIYSKETTFLLKGQKGQSSDLDAPFDILETISLGDLEWKIKIPSRQHASIS